MRKLTAIVAALGLLSSTSLPAFAAAAGSDVVKSDELSAAKKKKKKKTDDKMERKSGLILYRIAA